MITLKKQPCMKKWAYQVLFAVVSSAAYGAQECRSTDGQCVAWVQDTPAQLVSTGCGDSNATELWMIREPKGQPVLLVRGRANADITKTIADIRDPCFSLNGKLVYFVSAAWATSGSIQCVDVRTGKVRFISDGNSVEVIRRGPDAGKLLVSRSLINLDKNGESLGRDSYAWLVSGGGRPIAEIGLDGSQRVEEFRRTYVECA